MARPRKKAIIKEKIVQQPEPIEPVSATESSFLEYLRFGESYTSLILGIIVVIISTALLLTFVHNKNTVSTTEKPGNELNKNVASNQQNFQISTVPSLSPIPSSMKKDLSNVVTTPTKTIPTTTPNPIKVSTSPVPTVKSGEYVVKPGDTLWSIAEKNYQSGYNWVDIAKANNLSNPGVINAGNKLVLPKVSAKQSTLAQNQTVTTNDEQNNKTYAGTKIVSNTYNVIKGDTLWSIAERTYGNGEKWTVIATANNLVNPQVIHSGNTLKLPKI